MLKKVLTVAVAMSVLMAGALPAIAEGDDEGPVKVYDEENHILMFAVEGECMLDAEMTIEFIVDEDGDITPTVVMEPTVMEEEGEPTAESPVVGDVEGEDPLEGCYPFSVEGPNGQVNHGTFVSNLMHALKEMGIKGSDKKEFKQALKGYGKGEMKVKANDDDGEMEEGETSEVKELKVKPAKAEKSKKDKPTKGKSNRGNK